MRERLLDVSRGGFALATYEQLEPGQTLELKVIAAGGESSVPVAVTVVHVRPGRQPGLQRVGCAYLGKGHGPAMNALLMGSLHALSKSAAPPRLEIGVEAMWSGPGGDSAGALYLANLGLDGALVHGTGLPPVGGPLIVGLYPPDQSDMVALPGKVLWSLPAGEGAVAGLGFALETFALEAVASYLESVWFSEVTPWERGPDCLPATRIGGFEVREISHRGRTHTFYRGRALRPEVDAGGAEEVTLRRFTGSPGDVDLWSDRSLDAMRIGVELGHHPGVLKVFGATRERDASWLATERFPSTSLDQLLSRQDRRGGAPPVEGLVAVMRQAVDALAVCHEGDGIQPVVHGDLRPSCILIGDTGEVKVTGFGCVPAELVQGEVRVPPDRLAYLPPELFRDGGAVAPQADVYQLAVILYEALTGVTPFDALDPPELERQIAAGALAPSRLNRAVSPALDQVVLGALSADPRARPPNARALLDALDAAAPPPRSTPEPVPLGDEPAGPAPALPELLQKVVTRSGLHAAFRPEHSTGSLALAARAHLESAQRWKVRQRGLQQGDMLGRYEIIENINRGGRAEVYRARVSGAAAGEPEVVLKTIFQQDAGDLDAVKRFLTEARGAAMLAHPNIVRLLDYGFDRGRPFIAMEWVHGQNLAELLAAVTARGLALSPAVAARIVSEACEGLGFAHGLRDDKGNSLGFVHRDVSARNIMVSFGGEVKILDFGISRFRGSSEVTDSGRVAGTGAYLAPEQIREEPVERAADIWALGVNLYRLLAGTLPFERDTLTRSATAVLQDQQPPAHEVDAAVPVELSKIAERALQKKPAARYQWASEMRADLETYLAGKPSAAADLKALLAQAFPGAAAAPPAPIPAATLKVPPPSGSAPPVPPARAPAAKSPWARPAGAAIALTSPLPGPPAPPDDLDIMVTVTEDDEESESTRRLRTPRYRGPDPGPEATTQQHPALPPRPPPDDDDDPSTSEIDLAALGVRASLARPSRGPLGLVAPKRNPLPVPVPAAADDGFERFSLDPFEDAPDASAIAGGPVPSVHTSTTAKAMPRPAFATSGASAAPPESSAPSPGAPNTALAWLKLWCQYPQQYLVVPGEAQLPRIWVAKLLLDGFLTARPDDTTFTAFDAWVRTKLPPAEDRWLGEALLCADPERDHANAIAALLAWITEHDRLMGD